MVAIKLTGLAKITKVVRLLRQRKRARLTLIKLAKLKLAVLKGLAKRLKNSYKSYKSYKGYKNSKYKKKITKSTKTAGSLKAKGCYLHCAQKFIYFIVNYKLWFMGLFIVLWHLANLQGFNNAKILFAKKRQTANNITKPFLQPAVKK